jgi:hypothetical protein
MRFSFREHCGMRIGRFEIASPRAWLAMTICCHREARRIAPWRSRGARKGTFQP